MLKIILSLVLVICYLYPSLSQSVTISMTANCFDPAITIPYAGDVNGKPAYNTANGNLGGLSPAQLTVLWNGSQWQILVGGGTLVYFNNSTSSIPLATGWEAFVPSFPLGTCGAGDTPPTLSGDVLPIELVFFAANQSSKTIILNWITASELNNKGFEIEKSIDGVIWESISFERGIGTSDEINEYQYVDKNPFEGLNYFRLKQIDFDEKSDYSKIEVVNFIREGSRMIISPNPFTNQVKIDFKNIDLNESEVGIYDYSGRKLVALSLEKEQPFCEIDLSSLASGIYFVKVISTSGSFVHKIIKR